MTESTMTVYTATDGKTFTDKAEADKYETALVERQKYTSYWVVPHGPDLTEGRGWYKKTILEVYDSSYAAECLVQDYCFRTYGRPVAFVQGMSPITNWSATKLASLDEARQSFRRGCQVGDYKYKAEWVKLHSAGKETGLTETGGDENGKAS